MRTLRLLLALLAVTALSRPALGQHKVFLNASNQDSNSVSCGGVESTYAADEANRTKAMLEGWGFSVYYSQDFSNSPYLANDWGAEDFLSIHSNAGGGHGTETLYKSSAGNVWAGNINDGLMSQFGSAWPNRGLKYRDDLWMLNGTNMPSALTEVLFHDCMTNHSTPIGTMSEACFLVNADGRALSSLGMAQGICAHYGVSCTVGPPPAPLLSMATSIDTIAGQDRDFAPTDGTFDMYAAQETMFYMDIANTAEATMPARNVIAGLAIDAPLEVVEWHIYDNYSGNACGGAWCLNDSDTLATQPSHTAPGASFELQLSAASAGETKRIGLRVRATASSDGAKPEVRCWVRHVDNWYEKAGYDATPNNVDSRQTWNGGDLKIKSFVQAWPAATPDAGPQPTIDAGTTPGIDASTTPRIDGGTGLEGGDGLLGGCRTAPGATGSGGALLLLLASALALTSTRRRGRR